MRQAIKGDGSDGTAALKAYLLAHDEVKSQELYEFTPAAIGGGIVTPPAPAFEWESPTSALMRTTNGSFSPYESDWASFGAYTVAAASGTMNRWYSVTLGGYGLPGTLFWTAHGAPYGAPGSDSSSVPARSKIARVYAVFNWYTIPDPASGNDLLRGGGVSIDGGVNWINFGFPPFTGPNSPTEFAADITGAINSAGGIASFDFNNIVFKASCSDSLLWFGSPPGWEWVIDLVAIRVVYSSPSGGLTGLLGLPAGVTDCNSPLTYAGKIYVPANIKNDGFKSKIGLDVDSLKLTWTFKGDEPMIVDPSTGATLLTMLQAFQYGLWNGVWVKWRRAYMPTFGDCDSLGAVSMFRGRIAEVKVNRLKAEITVNSITELFNRQIPQQLIEANNRSMQIGPGLPPDLDPSPSAWTYFQCISGMGGTVQKIVADQTAPTAGQVYAPGTFDLGYLLFQASPLQYFVAQVQHYEVIGGHSVFYLFKPLYVDPHIFGSTFAAFIPVPKDQAISGAGGVSLKPFPFVPLPEQAV
jgi:hypothetical protein